MKIWTVPGPRHCGRTHTYTHTQNNNGDHGRQDNTLAGISTTKTASTRWAGELVSGKRIEHVAIINRFLFENRFGEQPIGHFFRFEIVLILSV